MLSEFNTDHQQIYNTINSTFALKLLDENLTNMMLIKQKMVAVQMIGPSELFK